MKFIFNRSHFKSLLKFNMNQHQNKSPFIFADIAEVAPIEDNRIDQNMSLHPYFDFDVPRNVTARLGQTTFLHCRVEQLGDKSVSSIK